MSSSESIYEKVRNFWNKSPCGYRRSAKEPLTKEYFDEVEKNRYFVEPHVPGFAEFDRWKGKKVLEIGCGMGTDTVNFARAGADVTAVDFSERSLEICKKRFEIYGLKAKFYHGNAENLRSFLPLETYDLIYSFGVIHHTPNPKSVIEELRFYSGPETELRMMLYSKVSWKLFWMMFEYGSVPMVDADNLVSTYSEAQTGCPVTFTYTFEEVADLLQPHFTIDKIWKDHIFTWNVSDYIKQQYVSDKYWKDAPKSLIDQYSRELGWHTLVRGRQAPPGPPE
jgi:SAM-dependent methyltransferase